MLLFKKRFLEAIRRGEKIQTIRLWKRRRLRAGQRSYIPGAGYIQITAVDPVELQDLTDEEAVLDGFASAELLRREIELLYPEQLAAGYRAYRVRFLLLSPEEQLLARQQRRRAKAEREQVVSPPSVEAPRTNTD